MDFVIGHGFSLNGIRKELDKVQIYQDSLFRAFQYLSRNEIEIISPHMIDGLSGDVYLISSAAVNNDLSTNSIHNDPQDHSLISVAREIISSGGLTAYGPCVAAVLDMDGVIVVNDQLGQLPVYHYSNGRKWLISNRIQMLDMALRLSGESPSRNMLPSIHNLVFGSVYGNITYVSGVGRLPYGCRYVGTKQLRIIRNPARDTKGITYEECIENAYLHIHKQLEAISRNASPSYSVVDITGGADSRCVLSFLMNSPLRGRLRGRCITRSPNPDAVVAGNLMSKYGVPVSQYPIILQGGGRFQSEISTRMNAAISGGGKDPGAPIPSAAMPWLHHYRGGYGEIGGASPGADYVAAAITDDNFDPVRMSQLWIDRRMQAGSLDLVTREGIELARQALLAEVHSLLDQGMRVDQLLSELYLRTRSRSHFGIQSYCDSLWRTSPDLLNNVWILEARRRLPSSLHFKNKVIFDLIFKNNPQLAMEPMANKSWHKSVLPTGVLPVEPASIDPDRSAVSLYEAKIFQLGLPYRFAPVSAGGTPGDSSKFALSSHTASFQALLSYFLDFFSSNHEAWLLFDRGTCSEYTRREFSDFSTNGQDTNAMGILASGLCAFAELEITPRISKIIGMSDFLESA